MLEKEVENYFVRRVKETGGMQRKFVSPSYRGVPDRICGFAGGKFAFAELKRPRKGAEAHQKREHNRWRKLGFHVFVIDTKESVDLFIACMTKGI